MDSYVINGGKILDGKVKIESAKNSVLPILASSILTNDDVIIKNCPKINDVLNMIKILNSLGVKTYFQENSLIINSSTLNSCRIDEILTKELRSSVFMLGSLISRCNKAEISLPGGCKIGKRPIDLHINSLKKLGVDFIEENNIIKARCEKIKNTKIFLPYQSVGATENIILASVLGDGKTIIYNSAKEPEIKDLCDFLILMGASIYGAGKETIYIEGVKKLHGCTFTPISDRIEAGTFLIASAITSGNIEVSNVDAKNIFPLLNKLCDNACKIDINNDIIHIKGGRLRKCFSIETAPFPFFPTDLQAQMCSLASVSSGISIINETIFETRFNHVYELIKMGANIKLQDNIALVYGVPFLHGAKVTAFDLRGGAALVLAALSAEGETIVNDISHIRRGYLDFEKKLKNLGADIKYIK